MISRQKSNDLTKPDHKLTNIVNRNIKIRAIASSKGDWKTKSNGFKEIYDRNARLVNVIANEEDADSARFSKIFVYLYSNVIASKKSRKGNKRTMLAGYNKNDKKSHIRKYNQMPQEDIMEEKIEEDVIEIESEVKRMVFTK